MEVYLTRVRDGELAELSDANTQAFAQLDSQPENFVAMISKGREDRLQEIRAQRSRNTIYIDPFEGQTSSVWLKAVDGSTTPPKIVGAAHFKLCPNFIKEDATVVQDRFQPFRETDRSAWSWISKQLRDRRIEVISESHVFLDTVFVIPEYHRRKIATSLVNWGITLSRILQVPFWAGATQPVRNICERLDPSFTVRKRVDHTLGTYFLLRNDPGITPIPVLEEN